MHKNSNVSVMLNGIIKENPVLVLILGTCPTLATTTALNAAFGMGVAAMAVLICSNIFISLLRRIIPQTMRIPCYIIIIAGFVTAVKLFIHAFLPALYTALGVYLDLITVNCMILGRAEIFANKNPVLSSALDGIGMGLGFTLSLCAIATIREILGNASISGISLPIMENYKIEFFTKAPGGLLVYGMLIALIAVITNGQAPSKRSFSCEGCHNAGVCNTNPCQGKESESNG